MPCIFLMRLQAVLSPYAGAVIHYVHILDVSGQMLPGRLELTWNRLMKNKTLPAATARQEAAETT